MQVTVRKNGLHYACQPTNYRWKCGNCLRGVITPRAKFRCAVCDAVVFRVSYPLTEKAHA